jgi:hypothetical protein
MRHLFRYIIIALSLFVTFFSLNSCGKDGIIDKDEMAQIYAEMLVTDQWINTTPGVRMIADTSLVYAPILERYGYNAADYRRSVDYYLNDPDTYADIMKETVRILDSKLADLNKRKHEINEAKERAKYIKSMSQDIAIDDSWLAMKHIEDNGFGLDDSLSVEWDSLSFCFNIVKVSKKLEVLDSLAVRDTLPSVDSLVLKTELVDVQNDKKIKFKKGQAPFLINDTVFKKL